MSGEAAPPLALDTWRRWLTPHVDWSDQAGWDSLDRESTVELDSGRALQVDWLGRSFMIWIGRLSPAPRDPPA